MAAMIVGKSSNFSCVETSEFASQDQDVERRSGSQGANTWHGVAWMLACLSIGLSLAVVQDRFYHYLHDRRLGQPISQIWATRIGTGLVFLTKTAFVTAVATAYVQRQWRNLKTSSYTISEVDDLTSVLTNLPPLCSVRLWFRNPLLFGIALLAWLLPIAVVVVPSTLTVRTQPFFSNTTAQVPQLQYDYLDGHGLNNYAKILAGSDATYYQGSDYVLFKIAYGAATSGNILSLPHEYPEMAYNFVFDGPAVKCFTANDTIQTNVNSFFKQLIGSWGSYLFLGCAPDIDSYGSPEKCFDIVSGGNQLKVPPAGDFSTRDARSTDVMRFYFINQVDLGTTQNVPSDNTSVRWVTAECQLYNATYDVDFGFNGAIQTFALHKVDPLNPVTYIDTFNQNTSVAEQAIKMRQMAYMAVMESFGELFAGFVLGKQGLNESTGNSQLLLTNIDWYAPTGDIQLQLEEFSHNLTLSLMSSPFLIYNSTARPNMPVTLTNRYSVFVYQGLNLRLAYGLSFGLSALCCCIGLATLVSNSGYYSNNFSTFVSNSDYILDNAPGAVSSISDSPTSLTESKYVKRSDPNYGEHGVPSQ